MNELTCQVYLSPIMVLCNVQVHNRDSYIQVRLNIIMRLVAVSKLIPIPRQILRTERLSG
jgi:hypothetical protein